jgi:peroxygenase
MENGAGNRADPAQLKNKLEPPKQDTPPTNLTALQQHILFWDQDNDGIIHPWDVYRGFRALGFNILFSIGSLLIPIFFSYPGSISSSWIPDWRLRIYVSNAHKAKHGSDTGVYDIDGHFHADRFETMFQRWDTDCVGGLSADQLLLMWKRNRLAADVAGWCFAFMELWTTWLLLQKDGRVWKDDLKGCYDGTIFWKIAEEVKARRWDKGYGISDFLGGMIGGGTWRTWELKEATAQGNRAWRP